MTGIAVAEDADDVNGVDGPHGYLGFTTLLSIPAIRGVRRAVGVVGRRRWRALLTACQQSPPFSSRLAGLEAALSTCGHQSASQRQRASLRRGRLRVGTDPASAGTRLWSGLMPECSTPPTKGPHLARSHSTHSKGNPSPLIQRGGQSPPLPSTSRRNSLAAAASASRNVSDWSFPRTSRH